MAMTATRDGEPFAPEPAMQATPPEPRSATAAASGQLVVVTLPGEIDVTNDGQVRDALAEALRGRPAVLVADGSETTFCGSSGMRALIVARRQAQEAGTQLRVAAGPAVRRILELTGADEVLDTYPSLAEALTGRHAPPGAGDDPQPDL